MWDTTLKDKGIDLVSHYILTGTSWDKRHISIPFFFLLYQILRGIHFHFLFIISLHCYWFTINCQIKGNFFQQAPFLILPLPALQPYMSTFSPPTFVHTSPNFLELSFLPLLLSVAHLLTSLPGKSFPFVPLMNAQTNSEIKEAWLDSPDEPLAFLPFVLPLQR